MHPRPSSQLTVIMGAFWTLGAFGGSQLARFATNVVLARLLAPELLGIMVIINSIRTGVELISDVGIGQNIIRNKNGDQPKFYNTAWSIQILRGLLLWIIATALSYPVAHFYQEPALSIALPVVSLAFLIGGFTSMSISIMNRRMQYKRLNGFDLACEMISSFAHILLVFLIPNVWSLILGALVASGARSLGSFFLLPEIRHRFFISSIYATQILSFGKWIFISSIVYYISTNFDRLFLGNAVALNALGVYGIARTMSDMLGLMINRLGWIIIFPFVSSFDGDRPELRRRMDSARFFLIIAAATGVSTMAAVGDWIINILYDSRYEDAGWMFPILAMGAWFAILCNINEATLMGFGKPAYGAIGNVLKLGWLLVGLPLGFLAYGILGAIIVVALGDLWRYFPILIGQRRERLSFAIQDLLATGLVASMFALWIGCRWHFALGTPFDGLLKGIAAQ